ncbi:MAG: glycosyltransferase family 2 protein [Planctomycetota bacterium]
MTAGDGREGEGAATPTFDVVIPAYNAASTVGRAVRSALGLFGLRQIIVVDDGSAEPLTEDDLGGPHGRVRLLRQTNGGVSSARNAALDQVSGGDAAWCVFLDADDELTEELPAALAEAGGATAVVMVGGRDEVLKTGPVKPRPAPEEWAGRTLPSPAEVFRPIHLFSTTGAAIRRELVADGLRFDPELAIGEDRDLLRRAAASGPTFVSSRRVVLYHRDEASEHLSGPKHADRRVRDFVRIVGKHLDVDAARYFEPQAARLAKFHARHGRDADAWRALTDLCRAQGWSIPLKAKLLRLFKS